MTYNLATRLNRVGTRMKELNDNSLTYTRSGETPIEITNFTPEKCDSDQLLALGIAIVNEHWQDIVFDTAALSTLTIPEPRTGDKVTWDGVNYQVTALADEVFRYTTASRVRIRVHMKEVNG